MISLAQRVRDFRYSKGWGPDELASRADISRTALYQIESGKTGLPRAGTLRRIAVALDVTMDDLLGPPDYRPTRPLMQSTTTMRSQPYAGANSRIGSPRKVDRWPSPPTPNMAARILSTPS